MKSTSKSIQKRSHPLVLKARQIRQGKLKNTLFCEGFKLVEELLDSKLSVFQILCTAGLESNVQKLLEMHSAEKIPVKTVHKNVMDFISDLDTSPGFVALAKRPDMALLKETGPKGTPLILVLHQIQLPQNVGALVRTAEGAGVTEIWTTRRTSDPYGPKALRGASGSAFRMPIYTGEKLHVVLRKLHDREIHVVAATQEGDTYYDQVDWGKPTALVLGSEGSGFNLEEMKYLKNTLSIPMRGKVESLNVAGAGAVCLFEANRQRRQ